MSTQASSAPWRTSVVVPARNAAEDIEACIAPLTDMRERGEIERIVVVDDGSNDRTVELARRAGADQLLSLDSPYGAAGARNQGAAVCRGDIIWFVDADVVLHEDAARQLHRVFARQHVEAVFGAYGDRPAAGNFLSQYKNLVHHYTHQQHRGETDTFWTGCGAVRRDAFEAVGGFDDERFRFTGMEDIDLGYRLSAAGYRIWLEPALLCEHRKRWTLLNLLRVEIFHRALPWARLMLEGKPHKRTLNIDRREQLRAGLAGLGALALVLAPWLGWPLLVLMAGLIGVANHRLLRFFCCKRGPLFALRALLFHQLYYLYSATTFVYAWLEHRLGRKPLARDRGD